MTAFSPHCLNLGAYYNREINGRDFGPVRFYACSGFTRRLKLAGADWFDRLDFFFVLC